MSMTKEEKLKELLKDYECKFHSFPSFDNPHGCTDCYNTGYILDSLEMNMLVDYDSENNELKSKLKAQQELINKLQKEKAEFVELLKLIKIVHYDNLPMCHSEWSLLDSDVEKKIKKILGEDKSLQTSEDHVQ